MASSQRSIQALWTEWSLAELHNVLVRVLRVCGYVLRYIVFRAYALSAVDALSEQFPPNRHCTTPAALADCLPCLPDSMLMLQHVSTVAVAFVLRVYWANQPRDESDSVNERAIALPHRSARLAKVAPEARSLAMLRASHRASHCSNSHLHRCVSSACAEVSVAVGGLACKGKQRCTNRNYHIELVLTRVRTHDSLVCCHLHQRLPQPGAMAMLRSSSHAPLTVSFAALQPLRPCVHLLLLR